MFSQSLLQLRRVKIVLTSHIMGGKICDRKLLAENCVPLMKHNLLSAQVKTNTCELRNKTYASHQLINIALLALSLMTFVIFWFTNIYNRLLLETVILRNGSEMLDFWTNPPIDPILKIYVFNYTNIADVISGAEKVIKLQEVGPYVYRERIVKTGLTFEGHEITYFENRSHTFLPHLSGGLREDDIVIVPNIPVISGIPHAKSLGFIGELGYKGILASTKPKEFQNLTIEKYFKGYSDNFMSLVSKVKWDFNPEDVAIFAPRRGVSKKSVTISAGTDDAYKVGQITSVGGQKKLNIWKSDTCNDVSGSDGIINGPPLVQNKEELRVYLPNFCRSFPLVFDRETKVNGMRSYRYKAPFGGMSPGHKGYCELKSLKQKHVDGVLDVSDCIDGNPPVLISHPHLMEGDEKLFEHFEGLNPNRSLHESFAHIHPRLSVPISGVSRMQLNIRMSHFGNYYKKLPSDIILPLVWIETTTDEFPVGIKTRLFLSTVVVDLIEIFFKIGSIVSLTLSILYLMLSNVGNLKRVAVLIKNNLFSW